MSRSPACPVHLSWSPHGHDHHAGAPEFYRHGSNSYHKDQSQSNLLENVYSRRQIKNDQPGSHDFRRFLHQFLTDFPQILQRPGPFSIQILTALRNFVKLYSVFQKLDHLTCSKLKLRRPSITPNSRILLHGLIFEIINIILRIFHRC